MRTSRQKKTLMLVCLLGVCLVCVIIGFAVVATPAKITFNLNCGHEEGESHANCGELVKNITGAPTGKLKLPTPVRPGYRFDGWTDTPTRTTFVTKINKKKMNLYAQWTQIDVVASLYVSGQYLRDVTLPALGTSLQDDGHLGYTSSTSGGLMLTQSEMSHFGIDPSTSKHVAWYYYDEKGDRVELRWDANRWRFFINGVTNTGWQVSSSRPFNPSGYDQNITSGYRVALNAFMVDTETDTVATYRKITIRYYGVTGDGEPLLSGSVTQRLGTTYTINAPTYTSATHPTTMSNRTLVGWRLQNESNIFQNGMSIKLDQSIWNQCERSGTSPSYTYTLKFYAVTVTALTPKHEYDKFYKDGRFVYDQTSKTSQASFTITDKTAAATDSIEFDFAGGYGQSLKMTTKKTWNEDETIKEINPIELSETNRLYDKVASNESSKNISPQTDGTLRLPLANSFAVAGMFFDGWKEVWKNGASGKVHPAGLVYQLPLGMKKGDLSFTAVWKSTKELISFDLDGGEATWNANAFQKNPEQTVKLPEPKRYGYIFLGWNEGGNRDAGVNLDITYDAGDSFDLTIQRVRLIAVWQPRTIERITLFSVLGTVPPITNTEFGDVIILERVGILSTISGWEFLYKGDVRTGLRFEYGVPFINKIYVKINEDFCKEYTGSKNDNLLFKPNGNDPSATNPNIDYVRAF